MINIGTLVKTGLSSIKSAFSWIADPKNHKFVLVAIVVIMGIFVFRQCNQIDDLEVKNQRAQSNIQALNSELVQTTDSLGNVVAQRGALQGSLEEIQDLNSELVDSLEYLIENPLTVTDIRYIIRRDTVFAVPTDSEFLGDGRFKLTWEYTNSGDWGRRELGGETRFTLVGDTTLVNETTDIVTDVMEMNITTGFEETDDGMLRVYATTKYPGAEFLKIDGAILDPKNYVDSDDFQDKKRWGFGPNVSYGMNTNGDLSIYIGAGIQYNLIRW